MHVSFQISFCLFWIYVQEWKKFCHITLSDKWWNLLNLFIKYFREFCPEKAMAPHSSSLAWKIPWMEEPGRLQSMGSLRVGHDWATSLSLFTFTHWRRKWQPTPVFLPGESQRRGSLVAAVYGVAQSRTRLSSSSSREFSHIPVTRTWCFYCYGFGFQSPVEEQRSHKSQNMGKTSIEDVYYRWAHWKMMQHQFFHNLAV